MRVKLIVMSILLVLFAIIASQNTVTTALKFLFWSVEAPLIVMIVVIFLLGLVIGLIACSNYERKKKKEEADFKLKKDENSVKSETRN